MAAIDYISMDRSTSDQDAPGTRHPDHELATLNKSTDPPPAASEYPEFEACRGSTKKMKFIIAASLLTSVALLLLTIYLAAKVITSKEQVIFPSPFYLRQVILFALSLYITWIFDGLGFVHATSLRWALYRENRLEFNTNSRLLTSSRNHGPNKWYVNALSAICLVLGYTSMSLFILNSSSLDDDPEGTEESLALISPLATAVLLVAILIKTIIAVLCFRDHKKCIPTWSSNPINNTLAIMHPGNAMVTRFSGRCMMPVADRSTPKRPQAPVRTQPGLYVLGFAKGTLRLTWSICVLSYIGAGIMVWMLDEFPDRTGDDHLRWGLVKAGTYGANLNETPGFVILEEAIPDEEDSGFYLQNFLSLLLVLSLQAIQALAFNAIELLVNKSRDENQWQKAYTERGAQLTEGPILAAVRSWRSLTLMTLKGGIHWLIGQALVLFHWEVYDRNAVLLVVIPLRVLVLAIGLTVVAIFTTILAFWRFKSPQPATYGHIQTLADLIDDWGQGAEGDGKLWWGDKGLLDPTGAVRHAGTSGNPRAVGEIQMEAMYAG